MDHHGFLTIFRAVAASAQDIQETRANNKVTKWKWAGTPVMYPESRCPFCSHVIRSPWVWLLGNHGTIKDGRLVGALLPTKDGKVTLAMPSHPHDTGGGYLCLGRNKNGVELLASTPNLDDCPMDKLAVPKWIARYWGHKCNSMVTYLKLYGEFDRIKELEKL